MPALEFNDTDALLLYNDDMVFYDGDITDAIMKPSRETDIVEYATTVGDYNNLLSWSHKHPLNWSPAEVLDWLYYVASQDKYQIRFKHFSGEAFRDKTGADLAMMRPEDFTRLMPHYGGLLFSLFQNLLHHGTFEFEPVFDAADETAAIELTDISNSHCYMNPRSDMADDALLDVYAYAIDFAPADFSRDHGLIGLPVVSSTSSYSDSEDSGLDFKSKEVSTGCTVQSSLSDSDCDEAAPASKSRRPSQTKGNHLWEFVRDLLQNGEHNPNHIKWENQAAGVFRFVHSEVVAKMWGQKKNNPSMTYEKLSRAMRFCRKAGYFDSVPKGGQFPKKLVFKFGPLCWEDGSFKD